MMSDGGAKSGGARPSLTLRTISAAAKAYSGLFAASPAAPVLSRPKQVRRTGFDLNLVVERITKEADDAVSLTLVRPDGDALPAWIPGAHLDVERLLEEAAPGGPEFGELEDQLLERHAIQQL